MEMLISFSSRTWHLSTLPKLPKAGSMTMVLLCLYCTVLCCPANSPDLNPIENLWGIVKRKMRDTRPNNADELKATVKETWASIPPQQCHKLITSMPRRIEAVIKAKGAPTKYWVHIQQINILSRRPTIHKKIFFIGLMKYSNLLRVFVKCEPKSSQLKEPKT